MDTETRTWGTARKKPGNSDKAQSEWTLADESTAQLALVLGSW